MPQTTQDKRDVWEKVGNDWKKRLPTIRHGDLISIAGLVTASNNAECAFSGGKTGIVETLNVGATIANGNGWIFNTSATNPKVYNDAERGKVMYNDFNNGSGTDLDATKGFQFSTPVAPNTDLYIARLVRAEVLTTAGAPYPDNQVLQWKLGRPNYANGISDDGDTNTGQELFSAILYNSNGRQVRIENNAGLATGTISSGTANSFTDSAGSYATNALKNRRMTLTHSGVQNFGVCASNTATVVSSVSTLSPTPANGDTYSIGTMQDYFGLSGLVPKVNSGWFWQEQFIHTSTQGQADGSYTIRYRQGGVIVDDTKANIPIYGGTKRFIYALHQDYFGTNAVPMTSKKVWSDDLFIMSGSTTRLVLSESLSIDACESYELQMHSDWSGHEADVEVNLGGVSEAGIFYIHEVTGKNTILSSRQYNVEV